MMLVVISPYEFIFQGNIDQALEYLEKAVISLYQITEQQAKNVDPNLLYW